MVRFYPMNQKSDRDWIRSVSGVAICGAYAVAPYTGDLKNGDFSIRLTTGVAVCGAYAVAPYTGNLKNGDFSICSATSVAVRGAYAIRPYPIGQKFIRVLVRFYPGNQNLIGIRFIRLLAWPFVGRMQYAPTLPAENSSWFRFVFIRGIKNRIGINFIRPLAWPFVGCMLLRPTRAS